MSDSKRLSVRFVSDSLGLYAKFMSDSKRLNVKFVMIQKGFM